MNDTFNLYMEKAKTMKEGKQQVNGSATYGSKVSGGESKGTTASSYSKPKAKPTSAFGVKSGKTDLKTSDLPTETAGKTKAASATKSKNKPKAGITKK